MKKIMFVLTLSLFSVYSFAQLGFGIKGGFTMSKLSTDIDTIAQSIRAGYQLGAFVRIGDKLHLQPEAYFTAKRGELKFDQPYVDNSGTMKTATVKQDITLSTVDIPVLIGYKIFNPPLLNVRIQAGPVASLVLNKKFDVTSSGINPGEPSQSYKDSFNDLNWALQVGAGVDFLFLTADVRYEIGLNDMYKSSGVAGTPDLGSLKNNIFFISVGWRILQE